MLMLYLSAIEETADKISFEKLYVKHSADIYRRVYGILKNKEDSEDACQETWTAVSRNMEFYRDMDVQSAKAYILGIAKNQARMILRRKNKESNILCDIDKIGENERYSSEESFDEMLIYSMCDEHSVDGILKCIEELGEPYSDVLLYHYVYDHTVKQISRITGEKENTVGSRLVRGRKKLMQLLIRRGYYD